MPVANIVFSRIWQFVDQFTADVLNSRVDMTKALAVALHRPAFLRYPGWVLKMILGDMARETMLGGQRVVPGQLLRQGFKFRYPELQPMLRWILGAKDARIVQPTRIDSGSMSCTRRKNSA
ncbi:DUF1731 domain-containing protein [Cognatiyoonia sp. IB215182]|uniref:DUF1731 domain-containing protein n=1 Tax=Cognatiyoonia sp. IB215182 TaxID=3097353 RepID=UPI0039B79253